MQITKTQAQLGHIAAQHGMLAVPREEGDVAVFIPIAYCPFDEIEVVRDLRELRAALGY